MDINVRIAVSDPMEQAKASLVVKLSNELVKYFQDKDLDKYIKKIEVKLLMVYSREGYEKWNIPKKPKYIEHKMEKIRYTNDVREIRNTLTYEYRLDDEVLSYYLAATDNESFRILANEISKSITKIKLPRKVKDFDVQKIQSAIEDFIKEGKW